VTRVELPVDSPLHRTLVGISRWRRPSPPRKHSRLRGVSSAPPPASTPVAARSGAWRAAPHGGGRARSSRRREAPVAARGSLGAEQQGDGSRKRASSRGDEETFMACGRICACYKRVFYVFQMFYKDVASVSCECCKSRSGCFNVET
jgi:hypothetical protein